MSDAEKKTREVQGLQEDEEEFEEEEAPRNPFDNPLFLPILLFGLTLWFGYDAWLNSDPEMLEHLTFNRVGFAILVPLLLYFGYKARQEIAAARRQGDTPPD